MKLLSFLSLPRYEKSLKAVTSGKSNEFRIIFPKLIKILSSKSWDKKNQGLIEPLLIALHKSGQNVLEQLINKDENNNEMVKLILKKNLTIENLDLILNYNIEKNLSEETADDMI